MSVTVGKKIRVLVVDDSPFFRQVICDLLKANSKFEVAGSVQDGGEAIRFLATTAPEVVILDLEMPRMDGFTFLRWLMSNRPIPVVVVSGRSEMVNVFKALELGAVDFLAKPKEMSGFGILKLEHDLIVKSEAAAQVPTEKLMARTGAAKLDLRALEPKPAAGPWRRNSYEAIVIGASTGGPPAVQAILAQMPQDFPGVLLVAQHMPADFTRYYAERVNRNSNLVVKEGEDRELLKAGTAYIAPGGLHMAVKTSADGPRIGLQTRSENDRYSPSVDILMASAALVFGPKVLGVLLTGMGHDGKRGMTAIRDRGGATIAESEDTAVVFGMPREAIQAGVVEKILPLHDIAGEILARCRMSQ